VEGKWKSFVLKMIDIDTDIPRVLDHMRRNFYRDEPLSKLAGFDDDLADDFDVSVEKVIREGISFIAVHEETNKVCK